jgi:hypothetical protein
MTVLAYPGIISGLINIGFIFLISFFIKTKIRFGLIGIIAATSVWQICMGLELASAYSDNLYLAKIFSWIGGFFIMSTPGFLWIFVIRFSNKSKSWEVFSIYILFLCFAIGTLSPWGIKEYSFENGEYITKPGILHYIHVFWSGLWIINSFGFLIINRLFDKNMTIINAHQIDIFLGGLAISFIGVILSTYVVHNIPLATIIPLLTPISAIISFQFLRKIVLEKPKPVMPENIIFSGPYRRIKTTVFKELGMNIDVYPVKKFNKEQIEYISQKECLFPEDGLDKLSLAHAMAVTIVNRELVVVVRSKYDGIVRCKDLKMLTQLVV